MKIKQTIFQTIFAIVFIVGIVSFSASPVYATTCGTGKSAVVLKAGESCCGGVVTTVLSCDQQGGKTTDPSKTGIWGLLMIIINIMTAGIAVVGVGGVVYGSILYTAAGGNAEQVKKGRDIIRNTIFGLVMYALMFAFLNYLIPGGIFS